MRTTAQETFIDTAKEDIHNGLPFAAVSCMWFQSKFYDILKILHKNNKGNWYGI